MTKNEIEVIEGNKEIAIAGDLKWSIVIESMILNTYREALNQGKSEQYCDWCSSTEEVEVKVCKKCRQGIDDHR